MGQRDWQPGDDERQDRMAGMRHAFGRMFGDGENPLAWGFRFASLGPTPIKIHLLFVVYLLLELIFTLPGNRVGFDFVLPRLLALVVFVLLRELLHALVARRCGGEPIEIMLWPMGGLIPPRMPEDSKKRLLVALSPLLFNMVMLPTLALPLYLMTREWSSLLINPFALGASETVVEFSDGSTPRWLVTLASVYAVNLTLLVLNLVPMYPLDGARVLEAILSRGRSDLKAQSQATLTGLVSASVLAILGLVMEDGSNLFLLSVVCGLVCMAQRRRLQFLEGGDLVPGLGTPEYAGSENPAGDDGVESETDQAEIDRILAKISEQGMEALSRKERRTLKRATESSRQSQ